MTRTQCLLSLAAVVLVLTLTSCTTVGLAPQSPTVLKVPTPPTPEQSAVLNEATSAFESKDYRRAFDLWFPLAESGVSQAQSAIAYLYATGLGTVQSDSEALVWFTKAAHEGDADAQNNLGVIYAKGGTKATREQAIKWYLEAARRGHRAAQQNLVALNNDNLERKVAAPASSEQVQQKAYNGEPLYQFLFGMSYLVGNGTQEVDDYAAVNWIQKAADQGYPPAEYQLGLLYLDGRGLTPSPDAAYLWISRAAEKKYAPAVDWIQTAKAQRANLVPTAQ